MNNFQESQQAISSFLDRQTHLINALAAKIRRFFDRLREYRQALISAAVTGQIDVCSFSKAGNV